MAPAENGPDVLLYSTRILLINVKRSQLDVNQGCLNLRMPHELHERWEAHSGPDHSEANVWRNRCGLAWTTPVVKR